MEFATYLGVDPSTEDTSRSGTRIIENLLAEIVSRSRDLDAIVSSGSSIWSMSPTERTSMVDSWKQEIGPQKLADQLAELHRRHQVAVFEKRKATQDIDARCLETSKNQSPLKYVSGDVLITHGRTSYRPHHHGVCKLLAPIA